MASSLRASRLHGPGPGGREADPHEAVEYRGDVALAIAQKAIEEGMRTLRVDGWRKVRDAQTTLEEVLRVTQTEEHLKALVEDTRLESGARP